MSKLFSILSLILVPGVMIISPVYGDDADFGDAPDGVDVPISATATVTAGFPSLLESNGARHFVPGLLLLGGQVDAEADSNQVNFDKADDGLSTKITSCKRSVFTLTVDASGLPKKYRKKKHKAYINLWADWNQDGDWQDSDRRCRGKRRKRREWFVRNKVISMARFKRNPVKKIRLRVKAGAIEEVQGVKLGVDQLPFCMRASLTLNQKFARKVTVKGIRIVNDGRGSFLHGETEDYCPLQMSGIPIPNPTDGATASPTAGGNATPIPSGAPTPAPTQVDECPNDPNKVKPGVCGCGVAETDSDSDGTADCNDDCENDPNKTTPGICGCGTADTDSDSDGTPDCEDFCVNDPDKLVPGVCGCGEVDIDNDSDGSAVCAAGGGDDCDDGDGTVYPGAPELCEDCVDNNCNGRINEGCEKQVFVTSAVYNGNLGDLDGANSKCQTAANNAGLSGTFKAWISVRRGIDRDDNDILIDPKNSFTREGKYQLVNGDLVANCWKDLVDGSLQNPIERTESNGVVARGSRVWTNTKTNGAYFDFSRDCSPDIDSSWDFDEVRDIESGHFGYATSKDKHWTTSSNENCLRTYHLYCFEQ